MPGPGYLWSPGNWSWDEERADYYWVPGTWVEPPRPGLLWTPGYWGAFAGGFIFHPGYWGDRVGFYGGINYGFGYGGVGYEGGRWDHGQFFYNRTVNNLQGRKKTPAPPRLWIKLPSQPDVSVKGKTRLGGAQGGLG